MRPPKRARVLSNQQALAVRRANQRRRRAKSRNAMVSVPRKKIGFPQSLRTTLRYVVRKDYNVSSLANIEYERFRANGMFDPEVSLGGHQPRGFDQAMALYQTFTVLGSTISVNFAYTGYDGPATLDSTTQSHLVKSSGDVTDAPASPPVMVGIYKGTEALTLPITGEELMEHSRVVWKPMNSQQPGVTVRSRASIASFFGKRSLVGAEGYTGSDTADPAELVEYWVWVGRTGRTAAGLCHISAYVTIEFDAIFTEPKVLQAS